MAATRPSLEYLVTSSQQSLESFELSRLSQASNLRKELRDVVEEWVQTEVEARFARWILECRRMETSPSDAVLPSLFERAGFVQLELPFESRSHSQSIGRDSREIRVLRESPVSRARPNQPIAIPTNIPDASQLACLSSTQSATKATTQIHGIRPPALDIRNSLLALMPESVRGLLRAAEQLAQHKATSLGSRSDLEEGLNFPDANSGDMETPPLSNSPSFRLAPMQTRLQNKPRRFRRTCMNDQRIADVDGQPGELHSDSPTHGTSPSAIAYNFAIASAV
jgi:hypothetical protein